MIKFKMVMYQPPEQPSTCKTDEPRGICDRSNQRGTSFMVVSVTNYQYGAISFSFFVLTSCRRTACRSDVRPVVLGALGGHVH